MAVEATRPVPRSRNRLGWVIAFLFATYVALTALQLVYPDTPRALGDLRGSEVQDSEDTAQQALLAKASLGAPLQPGAHDWPGWRGPRRDGISTETDLLQEWPEGGPRKLWEQPAGEGFSGVSVARGRAFTLFQDGDQETLLCCNAETGTPIWRFPYPARFRNQFGNGPRASPTIAGEYVYIVGGTGIMHCLHAFKDSPELVWRKDLMQEFGATVPEWGVSFSPLVEGERVFILPGGPGGNSVAALHKDTGSVLWKQHDDPAGYSSPIAATFADERQVLFFTATRLMGVKPDSGELLWHFDWATSNRCNIATPIVTQDYVFLSSGYGMGCAVLKIERTEAGAWHANLVYKNRRMKNHFSTSVLFGEHLYGFDDTTLVCLDFRTGTLLWRERGFDKGCVLVADGRLVVYGENGMLALAETDPKAYHEKSRFRASEEGASCWSLPAVADGRLYLRDQKRVTCYDVRAKPGR